MRRKRERLRTKLRYAPPQNSGRENILTKIYNINDDIAANSLELVRKKGNGSRNV